jgi:phage protein D
VTYQHTIVIKIDGAALDAAADRAFQECIVDQSLYIPDMFSMRFLDNDLSLLDSGKFSIGKEVKIGATVEDIGSRSENSETMIVGEITAVEPSIAADGSSFLVVRGYHKSWRAFRATKWQTLLDSRDDQAIVKAGEAANLKIEADSTSTQHKYLAQDNQSSGEYVIERSQRMGLKVLSEGGEDLKVVEGKKTSATVTLKLGIELMKFEPRATAAHQVNKVTVKGWDPVQKKEIVASADKSETAPETKLGPGYKINGKFGEAERIVVTQPPSDTDDAKAIAQGTLDRLNSSFIQAEGLAHGSPQIMPGKKVKLEDIGTTFSGEYMITSANHVYSNRVFETTFTVTGLNTNTFTELLNRQEPMKRWHGVYPAMVTDNNDPDDTYRVKVKFPWLDDSFVSDWARVVAPDAGPDRGFYFLPEIDDEVLVAFEHGDIHKPYILGRLWNGQDAAPKPNSEIISGGPVNERIIKSRSGHTILFDDTDGSEMIKIFTKSEDGGHTVTMEDNDSKKLMINSVNEAVTVTIDGNEGTLVIKTDGDITIESKENITIEATKSMTLNAGQDLKMEASKNTNLKGMKLALEGSAQAELKSTKVSVNGSGMTEIKGGMVKIN